MSNSATKHSTDREWNQVADKARDAMGCAGEMASHAASAIGSMAGQAACGMGQRADDWTANAGAGLHGLGDRIERNSPHEGMLGNASQAFARSVRDSGDYLQESKLSGMSEDVAELIRRNPLPSILIAISVGWFLARRLGS
jgi:hypothetical protein